MHCPYNNDVREKMMNDICELETKYDFDANRDHDILLNLIGKRIVDVDLHIMMEFWMISGSAINSMYSAVIKSRVKTGVG